MGDALEDYDFTSADAGASHVFNMEGTLLTHLLTHSPTHSLT